MECKNCGEILHGVYCSVCGQKLITKRITLRNIFQDVLAIFTNVEKGFLYTFIMLLKNPGEVVHRYISGSTVRYFPPLRYLVLWIAISVAISLFFGVFDQQQGMMQDYTMLSEEPEVLDMQLELQQKIQNEIRKYLNVLPLLILPFMGLTSYWLFRRRGQNYAEHLVLNAFAYGQTTAISIIFTLFVIISPTLLPFLFFAGLLLTILYYTHLYHGFYELSWVGAAVKALLTTVLGYALFIIFSGLIGMVIGIFIALKMKAGSS